MPQQVQQLEIGMISAINEARSSRAQGGIPIGAALADGQGRLVGQGHNQRVQHASPTLHAEIDCLEKVGRRDSYSDTTLYSTLMPCYMCAGAIIQFGIPRVVVGESRNFPGAADLLSEHNVEVVDLNLPECAQLLGDFIAEQPHLWSEDIGE